MADATAPSSEEVALRAFLELAHSRGQPLIDGVTDGNIRITIAMVRLDRVLYVLNKPIYFTN